MLERTQRPEVRPSQSKKRTKRILVWSILAIALLLGLVPRRIDVKLLAAGYYRTARFASFAAR